MDHARLPKLTMEEYTGAAIDGATVYGPGDERIGTIDRTYGTGQAAQVVIDVGGFSGMGTKPVLVSVRELDLRWEEDGSVRAITRWTRDDLKLMPAHED